jgi:hypothetical protein
MFIIGISSVSVNTLVDKCETINIDQYTATYEESNMRHIKVKTDLDYCRFPNLVENKNQFCQCFHDRQFIGKKSKPIGRMRNGLIVNLI